MQKSPSPGRQAVLAYLSRYTHRVAISNRRLESQLTNAAVTFRWKDYRVNGPARYKTMTLHVLATSSSAASSSTWCPGPG